MLKKIFVSIILLFLIISVLTINNISKEKTLRTNYEIEKITNINNCKVYLLDNNNYFVEVDIFINNGNQKDKIIRIIDYLKESNDNMELNFNGYIPKDAKLNGIEIVNKTVYLDFSKELIKKSTKPIKGIIKTLLKQDGIEKVSLKVEGDYLEDYIGEIENISVNEENNFHNRKDINKVVVYYYENIDDNKYLVPVTKYLNDNREKIEIIVEELKDNIPDNLIGYPNEKLKLEKVYEEDNILVLTFNDYIKNDEESITEIATSVFDNYDVTSVVFKSSNKIENIVNKNA